MIVDGNEDDYSIVMNFDHYTITEGLQEIFSIIDSLKI